MGFSGNLLNIFFKMVTIWKFANIAWSNSYKIIVFVMFKNQAAVFLYPIKHMCKFFWTASKTFVVDPFICRVIVGVYYYFLWIESAVKFSHVYIRYKDTH